MKWYLGFLTKDTVEIFRSSKTPTKALVPFYHRAVGPYASEDAAKRDARRQRVVLKNPGEVDSVSARELELYIENNGDLYRQMYTPVVNNLLRKMKKGTYNPILAEKGWLYLVDEGARRYNKEFGNGSLSLKLFDVPTRKEVARRFARSFEKEVEIGGYKLNPKPKKNPPLMVIGNPPLSSKAKKRILEIRKMIRTIDTRPYLEGDDRFIRHLYDEIDDIKFTEHHKKNPPKSVSRVRKGDIIRFHSYSLRVEEEPKLDGNFVILRGRINKDGSPFVTKKLFSTLVVNVDEKENPPSGDIMSDSVHEVRYTHRGDGEAYKHAFKKGVRMVAEEDGSVSMYHPTKRIHEEFPD